MQKFYSRVIAGYVALVAGISSGVQAQQRAAASYFQDDATAPRTALGAALRHSRPLTLNVAGLRAALATAPAETRGGVAPLTLALPLPNGSTARFAVVATDVMAPVLAAQFPQIRTYRGTGLDDPTASVRLDLTPQGFHAQILSPASGTVYIDPASRNDAQHVLSFYRRDMNRAAARAVPACQFQPSAADVAASQVRAATGQGGQQRTQIATGSTLRTYRLAVATTGEYTAFHGGTVAQSLSSVVTTVNRVVGVYEKEVAVRLQLVANNNQLIYTNAGTDPYSNGNPFAMINENQATVDAVIGAANYDIGHVFGTNSGGVAGLGVVCVAGNKARGVTGSGAPVGDAFDIDYVAHEMGHQFGGNHTFNSITGACSTGTRNGSTAYEPGSGSTIMAYAGICSSDNLQNNSDAYFHSISLQEIATFAASTTCDTETATGNSAPTVAVPAARTLPISTPFRLTATATDPNGDPLTYCWEQMSLGSAASLTTAQVANNNVPLFRSFLPTSSPTRYFPNLTSIRNNTSSTSERLPTVTRTLSFRCTARDQRSGPAGVVGGVDYSAIVSLPVTSAAGPFVVTTPNSAVSWTAGTTQAVTWDVAGTNANGVNCATVDILLSTDGGLTYPTTLINGTPNDGNQTITVPSGSTTAARIMVAAADNYFFDISNTNFTITAPTACAAPTNLSAGSITQTSASVSFASSATATGGYTVTTTPATSTQTVTASPVSLTGLTPGTTYTVNIVSNCAGGSTAASFAFTTVAPPPCDAPTNLSATTPTTNSTTVSFTASATVTGGYTVTTTPATSTQTVTASPVSLTGLAPGTTYTVNIVTNCANGATSAPSTLPFTTRVANDDCATAVALASGTSCTPTSGTVTGATQSQSPSSCDGFASSSALDVWYSFIATGTQHTITANGAFDGALEVFSGNCGGLNSIRCRDQTPTGTETLTFNSLTAGTRYYVRFYPYITAGDPPPTAGSFTICVTGPVAPSCAAPTNLSAGSVTQTSASVSFTPSASATTYTVTTTPATSTQTVSASPVSLTGLTPGTTYSVSVASNCAGGATSVAATASFTTQAQSVTAAPVVLTPANGSLTNNNRPAYTGTAPANSTVTVFVDGTTTGTTTASAGGTWSFTQPTALANSSHTVYATALLSGQLVSPASNTNTFTVDTAPPSVVISSTAGSPTSTSPIPITVTFSETVSGFTAADVAVTGGSVGSFAGSGSTYTLAITPSSPGTVTVNIAAGVAQDAAGNGNTAAAPFSIIYDQSTTTAPVVLTPSNGSSINSSTPTYTGTAPGGVVIVYVDGVAIGQSVGNTNWSVAQPTPLANGPHTVFATAQLPGQLVSPASNTNTFAVDTQAPTVAISSPAVASGGTASTAPIPFTVTFTEVVTGFTASDLTISNGAVTTGSFTAVSGSTYTFTLTPATTGSVTVNVAASVAQDAAGNGNLATPSFNFVYALPITATTWTGAVSTDWFTAGNWLNGVPTPTLDATVLVAPRQPLIAAGTATARNLTLAPGTTLGQTGGTLDVRGNFTNNGSFTPTGGTVQLGATATTNILGSSRSRFWNLTVEANGVQLGTSAGASARRLITLNGTLATQGNPFLLESDATGTAMIVNNGGSVLGRATVQRYITPSLNAGAGYRHLTSPVLGATVGSLATGSFTPTTNPAYNTSATPSRVSPFPTIFGYDQSRLASVTNNLSAFDKGWASPFSLIDTLTRGQGYTVNMAAGQAVSFTGQPNNGTLTRNLGRNSGASAADAGWQLVGNPYPSPLDYSLVTAADRVNLDAAIYVFESTSQYGGSYRSYVNGIGGNPILPLGQGFFVRVSAGQTNGALSFRNAQRVTSYQNPTFHRPNAETRPLVQLTLRGATPALKDDAYVYFEAGATPGYDPQYDALKIQHNTGSVPTLFSLAAAAELSINGLPLLTAQTVVPLGIIVPQAGTYALEAAQLLNLSTADVYLHDALTGQNVNLRQQPSYAFTASAAGTLTTRFSLRFEPQRPTATTGAGPNQQLTVWPNPVGDQGQLNLTLSKAVPAGTVTLRDVVGRTVGMYHFSGNRTTLLTKGLATGTYLLSVTAPGQAPVTRRVVVE